MSNMSRNITVRYVCENSGNVISRSIKLKESSQFFKCVLKQQSGAQMNSETCCSCCNHSSCSYWPLEDPFIMHLQWKWWGTKSTVLLLCKTVFKSLSEANMKLTKKEFDAKKTVNVHRRILSLITSIVSALWRDLLMVSMNRRNDYSKKHMFHCSFGLLTVVFVLLCACTIGGGWYYQPVSCNRKIVLYCLAHTLTQTSFTCSCGRKVYACKRKSRRWKERRSSMRWRCTRPKENGTGWRRSWRRAGPWPCRNTGSKWRMRCVTSEKLE